MAVPYPGPGEAAQVGTDLVSLLGASGGGAGLTAVIAWFFFREHGKAVDEAAEAAKSAKETAEQAKAAAVSVPTLWKKMDAMREESYAARLADSKEYATKSDVATALRDLGAHLDKRLDALEVKIEARHG